MISPSRLSTNGSARKNGNTAILVNRVFQELQKEGIETELVQLSGKKIRGCIACYKYFENKDQRCSVTNDVLNSYVEKKSRCIRRHSSTDFSPVKVVR